MEMRLLNSKVEIALPSNEDIQRSFIGWKYGQVTSDVEIISEERGESRCHIYSLPYEFDSFYYLNNTFQGGLFNNVRFLMMVDRHPFEWHFFRVIAQDFSALTDLYVINRQPQKDEQQSKTPIVFPHLITLSIIGHEDYAEQFLVHNKCHLPRLLNLQIRYETLAMVTNNFTDDSTSLTCAKLTNLTINEPFVRTENFDVYFPLL